jgi:pilus assembly protein CpaE
VSDTKIGSIITAFSAGGGCGATTVAINIANELRIQSEEPVLMIDMDQYYGAISNYLGIFGKYGIAEVLEHEGPIDKNLIATSATEYKENFDFLGTRPHLGDTNFKSFNEEHLRQALEACKHGYKYTVIDAPRGSKQVSDVLASMSNVILVVFQMTVKDIKTAKLLVEELKRIGIKPQKIVPVANRFRRRGPTVPLEETKKVLGQETLQHIRNDFKNVTNSMNVADFLSECAPRSGIRKDFQSLASKIYNCKGNGDIIR